MLSMKHTVMVVVAALGISGCNALPGLVGGGGNTTGSNHAPPENTSPPSDALMDSNHPGLEACASNVSENDLEDALEVAGDFKMSCHELIVCGGLATSLGTAVVGVLLDAALGGGGAELEYRGHGVYGFGNGDASTGTNMEVTTMLGFDTSFGKAGDVIDMDLLDIGTYFTGAAVTASAKVSTDGTSSYSLGISFTGTGPGFELLGLGETPKSPFTIDSAKISAALGKIQIQTHIHQSDQQGHGVFEYDVSGPPQALASALSGDAMPFQLTGLTGGRADLGQTITITKFEIGYLDTGPSGYMNGTIAFDVTGGKLPYSVTFTYPNRKEPDVALACK